MGGWLLKTEPGEYSYDDLARDGRAVWDGVRNPVALKHLRSIRTGDECLIYHTGTERSVVGLARAATDAYPDPADHRLVVVDVIPLRRLSRPVSLAAIKADPRFRAWELARVPRLSVMPVPEHLWEAILEMGE
jgi:predicted RNA-binding protein with PUA-like domain